MRSTQSEIPPPTSTLVAHQARLMPLAQAGLLPLVCAQLYHVAGRAPPLGRSEHVGCPGVERGAFLGRPVVALIDPGDAGATAADVVDRAAAGPSRPFGADRAAPRRVPSAPLASGTRNQLTPRRNPRDFRGRFWAEPVIKQPASRTADQRRDPEQPQLRESPVANENRGTRAARRIH